MSNHKMAGMGASAMQILKGWLVVLAGAALVACGGGGGSAGTSPFGSGGGVPIGGSGGVGGTASASISVDVQRAAVSVTEVSSTETVQAIATVLAPDGSAIQGVVVSFGEEASSLLAFAPSSKTALTDANGKAVIDVKAASSTNTGATTVSASAAVGTATVKGSKSIQIAAGSGSGGTVATPAAINFVGSSPSGTAIVIKGTGGNGRSESAILTFRVVDASNTPINLVTVNFAINSSNGGATLLQATTKTNSDGLAAVTVSSGSSPATIVVTATVPGTLVSAQSDTLIVSNSIPIGIGFEIAATTYNLDGRLTGDSTTISAYVRDQFGNPVPDGVAVNFTTDFGVVASSTLGGCTTVNGTCTVTFRVQNPRPATDGIATVTATIRVGQSTQLVQRLRINMAAASGSTYLALKPDGSSAGPLNLTSCKQTFELRLSDGSGHAPAAGTTIKATLVSSGLVVAVKSGSPVLDQIDSKFSPVPFGLEVDASATTLLPRCNPAGTLQPGGFVLLEYSTSGGITFAPQRIDISYPQ